MATQSTPREVFMSARQITLPLRARRVGTQTNPNADLIGRSYDEGIATITVLETCQNDQRRVMVRRDIDGHTWSMPAWLMRLVFAESTRKQAA
jgi:hypothetical protein